MSVMRSFFLLVSRVSPVFIFFAALCCGGYAKGDPSQAWEPPNTLVSIEFQNLGNAIIVPVSVDGEVGHFLLDTGSSATVVDKKYLCEENRLRKMHSEESTDPLNAPHEDAAVTLANGAKKSAELYKAPRILLGGFELKSNNGFVASDDFANPEWFPDTDLPIDGILGMDLFRQHCMHIDYDRKRLVIFQSVSESAAPPGEKEHLRLERQVPCIRVNINGFVIWSRIDTGCLSQAFVLKESVLKDVLKQQSADLSDVKRVETSFLDLYWDGCEVPGSLRCGPYCEEWPAILTADNFNLVGAPFLVKCRWTFDFQRRHVYIDRGNRFNDTRRCDFDGIEAVTDFLTGGAFVSGVKKGSAGERAGIIQGDVIMAVNGRTVRDTYSLEIARIFHTDRGAGLVLGIWRSSLDSDVSILRSVR